MRPLYEISRRLNVARPVCDHLLGDNHTHHHRMAVGTFVMTVGVTIAKVGGHHELILIAFTADVIGYAVHGLGLTPFVEYLLSKVVAEHKDN